MATWDDVRRLALVLPETTERDRDHSWRVSDKGFAWERPLREADHEALGDAAPDGPILGVRVADPREGVSRGAPRARLSGGVLPGSAAWLTSDG
jgi:hypothetical protein